MTQRLTAQAREGQRRRLAVSVRERRLAEQREYDRQYRQMTEASIEAAREAVGLPAQPRERAVAAHRLEQIAYLPLTGLLAMSVLGNLVVRR